MIKKYLLLAKSSQALSEKLKSEMQHIQNNYQTGQDILKYAGIVLFNFSLPEEAEDTILRWLPRIISQVKDFDATVNNYSCTTTGVVHLRVNDHNGFSNIVNQLNLASSFICQSEKTFQKPHLPLTKKLSYELCRKIMMDYSDKVFYESFYIHDLILLKKDNNKEGYKRMAVFGLSSFNDITIN